MNFGSRSLVSVRLRKSPLIAPNNGAAGGADFLQFASVLIAPISRHGRGDEPNAYQTTLSVTSISVRWYLLLLYTKITKSQYFFAKKFIFPKIRSFRQNSMRQVLFQSRLFSFPLLLYGGRCVRRLYAHGRRLRPP